MIKKNDAVVSPEEQAARRQVSLVNALSQLSRDKNTKNELLLHLTESENAPFKLKYYNDLAKSKTLLRTPKRLQSIEKLLEAIMPEKEKPIGTVAKMLGKKEADKTIMNPKN